MAAIGAIAMLLRETGNNKGDKKLVDAGNKVEAAMIACTPKMKSQAAGKMGFGTREVGDLVASAL
jgi:3-isopropylmalate dehydrogenase